MTVVKIEGNIEWKSARGKGGDWVAVCDSLALTVQSETWATLMEDIAHTLNAIFSDLQASQELEKFLRDRGWRPVGQIPSRPADIWFDIPFITRMADRDPQVAVR